MTSRKIYKCQLTGYFIEFIIKDDIAFIETINTNFVNIKAFTNLLRQSVNELQNLNIKKIRQTVTYDDWNTILDGNTTWTIIKKDDKLGLYDIECLIIDFLYNFGKALDII